MRLTIGSWYLLLAACLALPGCATIEATLEALATGDDAVAYNNEMATLPGQQDSAARPRPPDANELMLPKAPTDKPAKRTAAKPRRVPESIEPAIGPSMAETLAAIGNNASAPPEPIPQQPPPAKLVGLDESQLRALLGSPTESEVRAPGKVWRYRTAGCTLSITLYPEVHTLTFRSLAYEVTSNDDSASRKYDCLPQHELSALAK